MVSSRREEKKDHNLMNNDDDSVHIENIINPPFEKKSILHSLTVVLLLFIEKQQKYGYSNGILVCV